MLSKFVAAAVLGSALIAAPAMAQTTKMDEPKSNTATMNETASKAGLWQGSKIIGLNVYNEQNEKIGSIKELMVDKSGNIASAVIGVGGFLGMGERDVAVKFADLKWSNEPVRSSNAAGGAGGTTTTRPATTGAGSNAGANAPKTYPDHAVFNASKDQLKAMPQFDYNK